MSCDARNKLDDLNKKPVLNNGYCFAFQKNGVCNNRNCKYIHKPNPDAITNGPSIKPPREICPPSSHQTQPMNPSRPQLFNLTKEQLDTIGPPNAGANSVRMQEAIQLIKSRR